MTERKFFGQPVQEDLSDDEADRVRRILADLVAAAREDGLSVIVQDMARLTPLEQSLLGAAAVIALAVGFYPNDGDSDAWRYGMSLRNP